MQKRLENDKDAYGWRKTFARLFMPGVSIGPENYVTEDHGGDRWQARLSAATDQEFVLEMELRCQVVSRLSAFGQHLRKINYSLEPAKSSSADGAHLPALLIAVALVLPAMAQTGQPVFSFGVLADIQYADQPTLGARVYRDSLAKLERCTAQYQRERLSFTVQLGDLVDAGLPNLDRIAAAWQRIPSPRYSVLGNHDFVAPRDTLLTRLNMPAPYYDFVAQGWRFLVLDGMSVSVAGSWPESHPHALAGAQLLARLKAAGARNAQTWNGALGPEQREWLRRTLSDALAKKQRAVVFCHFPTLAESCRPEHLLWDHEEVATILDSQASIVAAYMSGHDHRGGYAIRNGIHHVTLPGMVERDAQSACRVVDVFSDRIVLRTASATERQELLLRPAP